MFHQVNHLSLRYLRQQRLDEIPHALPGRADDPGVYPAWLPGSDQEVIKIQPQSTICFLDDFLDDGKDPGVGPAAMDTNHNMAKVLMLDILQRFGDPSTLHIPGRKTTSFSFVAFERSIGTDPVSPGNISELSVVDADARYTY
jgi:hypothetical protein